MKHRMGTALGRLTSSLHQTVEASIAGYLWAALGSPEAERRWNAAHSIRMLASLDRTVVIDHLMEFASQRSAGPFADAELRFYDLHAVQWFAISLARAAQESPATIARCKTYLLDQTSPNNRHVLTPLVCHRGSVDPA